MIRKEFGAYEEVYKKFSEGAGFMCSYSGSDGETLYYIGKEICMKKLPFGWALLGPDEVFDFVNGCLARKHGERTGIFNTEVRLQPQIEALEVSNKSAQRSWRMSKEYAEGLERIIDRYKDKFREAMLTRLELQDAVKDLLVRCFIGPNIEDIEQHNYYETLTEKSPINESPPPQYISKKEV